MRSHIISHKGVATLCLSVFTNYTDTPVTFPISKLLLTLTRRRLARSVETPLAETHLQETIVKTIIVFMKIILFTQPDALPLRE